MKTWKWRKDREAGGENEKRDILFYFILINKGIERINLIYL